MNQLPVRTLSDEDIRAIVNAMVGGTEHNPCRFTDTSPDDLHEAIMFYKKFNRMIEDSQGVVWKTFLALITTGTFGLLILGVIAKMKGIDSK